MDIRENDLIVVKIPSGLLAPDRVLVFVNRKRHEVEGSPVDEIQLQLGVDYVVEATNRV